MKFTLVALLAVAPLALAAPVDVQARDPGYGSYAPYSKYPPPVGGYTSYGSYRREVKDVEKREPGYGSYAPYSKYPPPVGGYTTYGSYRRAIEDFVKRVWA